MEDLDSYRRRWQDEGRRRADFHLHWPEQPYRADLHVLVAGCGISQAAEHALRETGSHVVGIDLSAESVRQTEALRRRYELTNLEVYHLPIEQVGELGRRFDDDGWLGYVPLRLPETITVQQRLPAGAAAALINQSHSDPDLVLFVDAAELRMVEAIDGQRSIAGIIQRQASPAAAVAPAAASLFQRLWWYDQVVFDASRREGDIRE